MLVRVERLSQYLNGVNATLLDANPTYSWLVTPFELDTHYNRQLKRQARQDSPTCLIKIIMPGQNSGFGACWRVHSCLRRGSAVRQQLIIECWVYLDMSCCPTLACSASSMRNGTMQKSLTRLHFVNVQCTNVHIRHCWQHTDSSLYVVQHSLDFNILIAITLFVDQCRLKTAICTSIMNSYLANLLVLDYNNEQYI